MASERQKTLSREISWRGIGVHTGEITGITLKPAPPGAGIVFVRSDLRGRPAIPARIENVSGSLRGTSLAGDGAEVKTVEHLLAALAGHGIDNLLVEVDGPELPMGDGSALPFSRLINAAGRSEQRLCRNYLELAEAVCLVQNDAALVAFPHRELRVACAIAFDHPRIGTQCRAVTVGAEAFEKEIAPARTFGLFQDARPLLEKGLIRGTSLDNTVVIGDQAVFSREGLRFPDEFVRHKILDLLGDLCLLGRPLRAEIVAIKSGHSLNVQFLRKMREVTHGEG